MDLLLSSAFVFRRSRATELHRVLLSDDILFDWLTVEEQIEFHARARGEMGAVTSDRTIHFLSGYVDDQEEICSNLLEKVNLVNDRHVFCKNLSGGMKRRLSLACAFIGQTKLVLLGNTSPLSSTRLSHPHPRPQMNPPVVSILSIAAYSGDSLLSSLRRKELLFFVVCARQWIRSMRDERSILLCTHFLEEADALADRMIIMGQGRILAQGTSMELKNLHGNGYKFLLRTTDEDHHQEILEKIQSFLPNAKIESQSSNQLIIEANDIVNDRFLEALKQIDLFEQNQRILNYSIFNTTLGSTHSPHPTPPISPSLLAA